MGSDAGVPDLSGLTVDFYFDPMCPFAHRTAEWIREVRDRTGLRVTWRFFSLEEVNRAEGGKHPWEREIAYGWTPLRIAAWLRRRSSALCDAWYAAAGRALHEHGRRPYDRAVAEELLAEIGAPPDTWESALSDPSTHDDIRTDHEHAVLSLGAFGVPILVLPGKRPLFGPVVLPTPTGDDAIALWRLVEAWVDMPGLWEMKTPKTEADLLEIGRQFRPYLEARQWPTIQRPAP